MCNFRQQCEVPIYTQKITGNLGRIATFANWPAAVPVSCLSLANSGFVYTGVSDQVICPLCRLTIKDWQQSNVSPLNEHQLRSPQCLFFSESSPKIGVTPLSGRVASPSPSTSLRRDASSTQTSASNIADVYHSVLERAQRRGLIDSQVQLTGNTATSREPETSPPARIDRINPDYGLLKHERERLSTFDDWPASDTVQPSALARAGLFYTGQGDRTRCAFCRGVLHRWQPSDDPDDEHCRHFPDCPFVRQQDIGNVPLQRDASPDRQMSALSIGDVINDVSHSTCGDSVVAATISFPGDVATSNQVELVNPRQGLVTGNSELLTLAENSVEQQVTQNVRRATYTLDDEEQMLMDENRRLHEAKTCKVCMDRDVNTVFLPCGHLVSCDQCSPKLRNCPICRTYIRGTVRTFLS